MRNAPESHRSAPDCRCGGRPAPRIGPVARGMLLLIAAYRASLGPALSLLGVRCRHLPTCSDYGRRAIARHGAWAGGWMTLARLSRCHPFGSSGWDPPPERTGRHGLAGWRYGDWRWTARPAAPESGDKTNP